MSYLDILPLNLKVCLFLTVLVIPMSSHGQNNPTNNPPNVVIINVDDLGWADLGFMGSTYYETPNLDRLSRESIIFTHAYAGAANCAPSRATMLTGRYPMTHGIYTVGNPDRGDARTRKLIASPNAESIQDSLYSIGKFFVDNGYATGIFGKWHISEDPSIHGFEVNIGADHSGNPGKGGYFSPYKINLQSSVAGEYLTDRLTDEAIVFVEENQQHPFFLYIPYYTVHSPLMGKPELVQKYKGKEGSKGQDNPVYAAMIECMDQNVGKLVSRLEELNLMDDTILIFTSDNGGIRSTSHQDPLRGGKGSYYEGGIRVPLLIHWKGQLEAGVEDTPVTQLDFFPTFKDIIAPELQLELDGQSLSPLLTGNKMRNRDLFWHFPIYLEAYDPKVDGARDPLFRTRPGSVIRSGNWKLHHYFEDGGIELYNLRDDPSESTNLALRKPKRVRVLLKRLENWRKELGAPIPKKANPAYDPLFEAAETERVLGEPK